MRGTVTVLDTGAGPNLVRKSEIPLGMEALIAAGPKIDITDAHNRPIWTIGTLQMPVQMGRFVALV